MTETPADLLAALAAVDLFEGLERDHLQRLARIAETRNFTRGAIIFHEGADADGLYAVVQGAVRIFKVSPQGREHVLHFFGPGEAFAEVVVFKGTRFPANAEAIKPSVLLFLPTQKLRDQIMADPDMAMSILALLSQRLRFFVHKIESLSLKETPARLAGHLLLLRESGKSDCVELNVSKGQLAAYLGTIPETVSRVLRKFSDSGILKVSGSQVTLVDRAALESIATGEERL